MNRIGFCRLWGVFIMLVDFRQLLYDNKSGREYPLTVGPKKSGWHTGWSGPGTEYRSCLDLEKLSSSIPYHKFIFHEKTKLSPLSNPSISSLGTRASTAFFFSSASFSCCFFNSSAAFCIISCYEQNMIQVTQQNIKQAMIKCKCIN